MDVSAIPKGLIRILREPSNQHQYHIKNSLRDHKNPYSEPHTRQDNEGTSRAVEVQLTQIEAQTTKS